MSALAHSLNIVLCHVGLAMIAILHDWQELASGILALVAGAFIFLQGALERRGATQMRAEDAAAYDRQTRLILARLDQASNDLQESVEVFIENFEDVLGALDREDEGIQLPTPIVIPKIFEVIFAQLTTRDVAIGIYIELSALMDQGTSFVDDFRRFLVSYGQTVTEHRPIQLRFQMTHGATRRPSDDPVAQTLLISTRALQDRLEMLRTNISRYLEEVHNGSDVRVGHRRVGAVQSVEGTEENRQANA